MQPDSSEYTYFSYDGEPCRIKNYGPSPMTWEGEVYVSGAGFQPGPTMFIAMDGFPISEAEFKQMVVDASRKRQS